MIYADVLQWGTVFAGELQSKHSWDSDKTRGMVQNTFAIVAKAVIRTLHSRRQGLIDRILILMKIKIRILFLHFC